MIYGVVNSYREATLPLVVGNWNEQRQVIDTVIDTGFSGFLSLPSTLITTLNLPWSASDIVTLGDGSETLFDMFDKAGIKPPEKLGDAWTWEKWITALKELTIVKNGRTEVYGIERVRPPDYYDDGIIIRSAGSSKESPTFKGVSADGLKATGYVDTDEAIVAFQLYQDIFQKHKIAPVAPLQNLLAMGKAAITIDTEAVIGDLEANFKGFNYGIAPLPFIKTPLSHSGSLHYAVSGKSKHPAEAAALVKFMGSSDNALIMF